MAAPKPFDAKPLPRQGLDWRSLVPAIGRATRALAHYDGALLGVPDPAVLLGPLTTQEAVLSSRIEGTQATFGEVLRFEAGEAATSTERREDIEEILNYRKALRVAEIALRRRSFSLDLLKRLHAVLLQGVRGRDRSPGRFRRTQVWIGAPGTPLEHAGFVPPEPRRVPALLANFERYWRGDELDPLVQLALLHAQFEIIHPFRDGNGRIGRILIPVFLCEKRLLGRPMFYLSQYFDANRREYIARLRNLNGPRSWNAWVAFFLRAIAAQAEANADQARRIFALYDRLKRQAIAVTRSEFAVPLLDRLFAQPVFASNVLFGQPGLPTKPAVTRLLTALREAGILTQLRPSSGRRAQVLALAELVNLCEGTAVL